MPGGIHPPPEVMLAWPKPNYVDPVTRPKTMLYVACIFGSLTVVLVFARLWVRIRIQRSAGWDDWLMVAALPIILALTVLLPYLTDVAHFNKHVWDVRPSAFILQRKLIMVLDILFCIASGLIKISILLFYRRLSSRSISKTFRWATWLSIGFIAAYSIAFTLVPIFGCKPISAFWDQLNVAKIMSGYKYTCFNEGADVFSAAVISTAQDLITTSLPTFLFWNLQIPIRQKVALFGIFAIGYGIVAVGAMRSYHIWRIFFVTYDATWETWQSLLWTLIELHVGSMCANAPALKVFIKEYLNLEKLSTRSKSASGGSRTKNSGSGSALDKATFWKSAHSHTKSGYLSEPHTEVSVDMHGGVRVQKDIHISHSPTHSSADMIADRYDDLDIEMGSFKTHSHTEDSKSASKEDLHALPRIESQEIPANAITTGAPPKAGAKNSISVFPFKGKASPNK